MTTNRADSTAKDVRVLTYKIVNDKKYFLLIRELNDNYTFPGSYKSDTDASLRVAAIRALRDSVGLTEKSYSLKNTNLNLENPDIYTNPDSGKKKDIVTHLFVAHYNSEEEIKASSSVQRTLWLDEINTGYLLAQEHMKSLFMHGTAWL